MKRFVAAALLVSLLVPTAAAANRVSLSLSRVDVATQLGDNFGFTSTVKNAGRAPLAGLVAHLNVVSLTPGVYVDPEDWSSDRTRYLRPLGPGQSVTIPWKVKAVNGGRFGIYVAVLPRGVDPALQPPAVSPALRAAVSEHRSLNSGGVVPLALGLPGLIGLLALGVRARRRRPSPSQAPAGAAG
jgi:hypothetical protein